MNWLITFTYCGKTEILKQFNTVNLAQTYLQTCKKDPNFNKGKLQLRTKKGFEIKKVL